MLSTWGKLGFEITFVDAPDRRDLELGKFPNPCQNNDRSKLNTGEICCLPGFARAMGEIIAAAPPGALVMEDDAIPLIAEESSPVEYVNNLVRSCLDEFPESEAVLLHDHPSKLPMKTLKNGVHGDSIARPPMMGNTFFYISKLGALYCRNWFMKMEAPADWVWFSFPQTMTLVLARKRVARHPVLSEGATTYIPHRIGGRSPGRKYIP
jgi:hypothetical protein